MLRVRSQLLDRTIQTEMSEHKPGHILRWDVPYPYATVIEVLKFIYSAHFDPLAMLHKIAHAPNCAVNEKRYACSQRCGIQVN